MRRCVGNFWSNDPEAERISGPPRHSRRLPPDEMERIILDLCRGRWMTRRDLAALVRRNPDNLRSRFQIPAMEEALANGNAQVVAEEAHAVKGGAANLPADELTRAARELEASGRSGDFTGCGVALERLRGAYQHLLADSGRRTT